MFGMKSIQSALQTLTNLCSANGHSHSLCPVALMQETGQLFNHSSGEFKGILEAIGVLDPGCQVTLCV